MTRMLIHRYDNKLDILAVEDRGYSDVFQRCSVDDAVLVAVVPTRDAGTDIAVVGYAVGGQYAPDGGAPWPGRADKYRVRINVRDVRYTTVQKVKQAVASAGKTWAAQWTVAFVDLDDDQLGILGHGFGRPIAPVQDSALLPGELSQNGIKFAEGATRQVLVNAYERNPQARAACIAHYGTSCSVCDESMGSKYGDIADGFVHVHHLKPLSERGGEYEVDPIADLRPVCPNCHAVLHLAKPAMTIEEARTQLMLAAAKRAGVRLSR